MNNFDKIIGYEEIKKELRQITDTLKNRDVYEKLGATSPSGLLLYGDPGVGKSMMANAVISESGLAFFTVRKNMGKDSFVDEIKATFDKAMKHAPAIVYLDDMDKFANVDNRHPNADEYVAVQACIDEVKGKGIFVLATANDIDCLPDSLIRTGRFDRSIEVKVPCDKDARQIIEHYMNQKPFVGEMDYDVITRLMGGRSCAELETVINEAGLYAGFQRSETVTMEHFLKACMRVLFKINYNGEEKDSEEEDFHAFSMENAPQIYKTAYHEAAHVVAHEVIVPGSVTLSTICAGDRGQGGVTSCCLDNVSSEMSTRCRVITSLASMAVSEQVFGQPDMGSSHDLDRAFRLTRRLVADNCSNGLGFYSFEFGNSETRTARIEEATTSQVEQYYRKVKELLSLNREFLDKVAQALLSKKLITCTDIAKIRETCHVVSVAA